jgi:hypothetical protein
LCESTEAYRLHKFKVNLPATDGKDSPLKDMDSKADLTPRERLTGAPTDLYFSLYVPGLVRYTKYQLAQKRTKPNII